MSKKTLGISIALFGVIIFFSNLENAWIVSAVLLGFGSGIFFWKD
jgi:multisubunit Na+/H+ antiporter MnhG subunit|tara:strand:+ start:488 stop:622 length:135 start_codon:yes stop_codon:yes gene_type:complete